jgi:hypothetical protein
MKYKFLNIVIYNENILYEREMKKTLEVLNNTMKNSVLQYFVTLSNKYNNIELVDNIIYIPGYETFIPGILDKTLKAIDYCVNILKIDFEYIVRSNISTVIDFNRLIIPNNNMEIVYTSTQINDLQWTGKMGGITDDTGTLYASGTIIILNIPGVRYLLNNINKINMSVIDDVSIGLLMKNVINVQQLPHKMVWNNTDSDGIVFRNRTKNRNNDIKRMKNIVTNIMFTQRHYHN